MRSARLSTAGRGSMLALALASAAPPAELLLSQVAPAARHPGAILVQATDTAINPLAAQIVLPAFGLGVRLSEEGVALFLNVPDGGYLIQARHLGYTPEWRYVRIAGDTARVDFVLPPADVRHGLVDGGLAESRLRDFLRRSGSIQVASFVTRAEIERRRPRNLVALLSRIPEVAIDRAGPGGATVVRSNRLAQPACVSGMLLFVDGMLPSQPVAAGPPETSGGRPSHRQVRSQRAAVGAAAVGAEASRWSAGPSARELARVGPVAPDGPTSARRTTSPLDWVPISLVGGVEIYPTGVDVPPEFRVAGADCGAVLIWTIRR